jgi:chromosome segregation ATPase
MYHCKHCKVQLATQAYLQTHEEFCAAATQLQIQQVKQKLDTRRTSKPDDEPSTISKLQTKIEFLSKNFNNLLIHLSTLETQLEELNTKIVEQAAAIQQLKQSANE